MNVLRNQPSSMKSFLRLLLAAYEYAFYFAAIIFFAVVFLSWCISAVVLRRILPVGVGRKVGRAAIMTGFRICLGFMNLSGRFHFDLGELDTLRDDESLIIAANHPSLWDVILINSRLPNVVCIMKADLVNNIFLGGGARMAGYIRNESVRHMITEAVKELKGGSQLLLFPEGTRTVQDPINPLKGSVGVIANRAKVPVQTVFIETNSAFLGKGWSLFKKPPLPVSYRIRLGRRFAPPENSSAFVVELEQYFTRELDARHAPSGNPDPVRETAVAD
jgi:1-acyl-sn-glycerol-3-phosphate acyltransferase